MLELFMEPTLKLYDEPLEQIVERLQMESKQKRKLKSMDTLRNTIEHLKHSHLNREEQEFLGELQQLQERGIGQDELPSYAVSRLAYMCLVRDIDPSKPFKSLFNN